MKKGNSTGKAQPGQQSPMRVNIPNRGTASPANRRNTINPNDPAMFARTISGMSV